MAILDQAGMSLLGVCKAIPQSWEWVDLCRSTSSMLMCGTVKTLFDIRSICVKPESWKLALQKVVGISLPLGHGFCSNDLFCACRQGGASGCVISCRCQFSWSFCTLQCRSFCQHAWKSGDRIESMVKKCMSALGVARESGTLICLFATVRTFSCLWVQFSESTRWDWSLNKILEAVRSWGCHVRVPTSDKH